MIYLVLYVGALTGQLWLLTRINSEMARGEVSSLTIIGLLLCATVAIVSSIKAGPSLVKKG